MRTAAAMEHPALKPRSCAREDVIASARAAASALDAAAQVNAFVARSEWLIQTCSAGGGSTCQGLQGLML